MNFGFNIELIRILSLGIALGSAIPILIHFASKLRRKAEFKGSIKPADFPPLPGPPTKPGAKFEPAPLTDQSQSQRSFIYNGKTEPLLSIVIYARKDLAGTAGFEPGGAEEAGRQPQQPQLPPKDFDGKIGKALEKVRAKEKERLRKLIWREGESEWKQ